MAQTLLRPEQVDDLVAQYREGATLVELASVFGVNRRTVATHLTRREVRRTEQRVAELLRTQLHPRPSGDWPAMPWPPF